MAKFEFTKTLEANKLNKRTGSPINEVRTISYGAVIENLEEDGDYLKFTFLGEPYRIREDILRSALRPVGAAMRPPPPSACGGGCPRRPRKRPIAFQLGGPEVGCPHAPRQSGGRLAGGGHRRGPDVLSGPRARMGRDIAAVSGRRRSLPCN